MSWTSSQYPDTRELTHYEQVRTVLREFNEPLHLAAMHGHTEILSKRLSCVPQQQRLAVLSMTAYTPLHTAAIYGQLDSAETILSYLTHEQQLGILSAQSLGSTPADLASSAGNGVIERFLRGYRHREKQQKNTSAKKGGILSRMKSIIALARPNGPNGQRHAHDETASGKIDRGIVNALIFYSQDDRPEATEEADTLQTSLSKVAARVDRHVWINGPDLQVHVQQILGELSANCSLLFISVMSHGRTGALCGPDGIIVPVNDLLERITKLIPTDLQLVLLVQACQSVTQRPNAYPTSPVDARRASAVGCMHINLERPNTVLLMATATGGYAVRGVYIKALSAEISKADGVKKLYDMHSDAVKAMREEMEKNKDVIRQTPEYRDTLNGLQLVLPNAED